MHAHRTAGNNTFTKGPVLTAQTQRSATLTAPTLAQGVRRLPGHQERAKKTVSSPHVVAAASTTTVAAFAATSASSTVAAAAAAATSDTTAAIEARLLCPTCIAPVTLAIVSFHVNPRAEHARRSNLGLVDVVDWPRRREVERPHERVSDPALVCRVVVDERLHVALELDGVRLQGGPQDALGAGKVRGSFGAQEAVLSFVVVCCCRHRHHHRRVAACARD